jgi:hypothetical protein
MTNKVVMKILVQVFEWTCGLFLLMETHQRGMAELHGNIELIFKETDKLLSKFVSSFSIPLTWSRSSPFSPSLSLVSLSSFSLSNSCSG